MQKSKKKQHIVPIVYLRRFASKRDQLYILDKTTSDMKPKLVNIKDVPTRRYFYDLSEPILRLFNISDPQIVEAKLSNWEALFGKVLESLDIRINERLGFEKRMRIELLHLVALQYLRTEFGRKRITRILSDYLTHHSPKAHANIQKGRRLVPSENLTGALHAKIMELMLPKFVARWDKLNVAIGTRESNQVLVTSDNPVSHIPGFPDNRVRVNLPKRTQVLFPLSPDKLLILHKTTSVDPSVEYIELADQDIICQNSWQFFQCTRHVISGDNNFEFLNNVNIESLHVVAKRELIDASDNDLVIDIVKSGDNFVDIICEEETLRLHLSKLRSQDRGNN